MSLRGHLEVGSALEVLRMLPDVGCAPIVTFGRALQGAFDSFAMGNYPYPSSYMGGALPAWPMRAACERLASPRLSSYQLLQACSSPDMRTIKSCIPAHSHVQRLKDQLKRHLVKQRGPASAVLARITASYD